MHHKLFTLLVLASLSSIAFSNTNIEEIDSLTELETLASVKNNSLRKNFQDIDPADFTRQLEDLLAEANSLITDQQRAVAVESLLSTSSLASKQEIQRLKDRLRKIKQQSKNSPKGHKGNHKGNNK